MPSATRTAPQSLEAAVIQRSRTAPLPPHDTPTPQSIFTLEGWNTYARGEANPPVLGERPDKKSITHSDARLLYHTHLLVVAHSSFDTILARTARALLVNANRREGLMDRCIDGWPGTGKTCLLRVIGRDYQQEVEKLHSDRIPVVHIQTPYEPDNTINWIWEIACFLGLDPAPKNAEELLQRRRYPDMSAAVHHVMQRTGTRLLLVDNIERARPDQLGEALHYLDFLREKLGVTTIFCGTGSRAIVDSARAQTDRHGDLARHDPSTDPKAAQRHSHLPMTWLAPFPLSQDTAPAWGSIVKGFENNLRLHDLSKGFLTRNAAYLHDRTGGYIKALSQLICQAAVHAILDGTEDITMPTLEAIDLG